MNMQRVKTKEYQHFSGDSSVLFSGSNEDKFKSSSEISVNNFHFHFYRAVCFKQTIFIEEQLLV